MTQAKIKAKLPKDGHGLTPRLADSYYEARAAGTPSDDLIVVGRLSSCGHGEEEGKRAHTWEFAQLDIVATDDERLDTVCAILDDAEERRVGHRQLPLDYDGRSPDEQRRSMLGLIEDDWAAEEGLTTTDIKERWREFWGIDSDDVPADGSFPHPDYKRAAPHHLREFALRQGVLADEPAEATVLQDGAGVLGADQLETVDA